MTKQPSPHHLLPALPASNMFTIIRTVSMLKGLQSPLIKARCNSSTVSWPELSVSTALNQLHSWGLTLDGGPWGGGANTKRRSGWAWLICSRGRDKKQYRDNLAGSPEHHSRHHRHLQEDHLREHRRNLAVEVDNLVPANRNAVVGFDMPLC